MPAPAELIQRQLEAYNRKDVEGWLATYHSQACQYVLHGELLARGHAQLRSRISERFSEPDLHAQLLNRTVSGNIVVDLEQVTRNFPQGRGSQQMLCIYEVQDGLIRTASFAALPPRLDQTDNRG